VFTVHEHGFEVGGAELHDRCHQAHSQLDLWVLRCEL
jgi:hypothetical protein